MNFSYQFIHILVYFLVFNFYVFGKSVKKGISYDENEKVELFVNKVGPFHNPDETYHYYGLPVCRPSAIMHKTLSLGEVLNGDRMAYSSYSIKFMKDTEYHTLCKYRLQPGDLERLSNAIENSYYYEFVLDGIPMRSFVGKIVENGFLPHSHRLLLFTHQRFMIESNDDQIIYATITSDLPPDEKSRYPGSVDLSTLSVGDEIKYTYSVYWSKTNTKYSERSELIVKTMFFPKSLNIHWLSIINSSVLVCLLLLFVIVILARVVRRDFNRYNLVVEVSEDDDQQNGWKMISSDVFRQPPWPSVFTAVLGVGSQFLCIALGLIIMGVFDCFNVHNHGKISVSGLILYGFTSSIAGCVSSSMYRKLNGNNWIVNIFLTACLFPIPLFVIWSFTNSVAWAYGTTSALPFTTILLISACWCCVGIPLTVIGGLLGRRCSSPFDSPCRTKNVARQIPDVPFYKSSIMHFLVGGFLPFSAVSVELYYIYATLWLRQHYTLFGILMIVFVILVAVTACVSVALTYFQLMNEDYRWWWRSIISSGAVGFYVFNYSLFFYVVRSNMTGAMQVIEFFGFSLLAAYVFFLTFGAVGFFSSVIFVRYIYHNLKVE